MLCLFIAKSSKDLKSMEDEVIIATMVHSGLSETDKLKTFSWNVGNLEVSGHVSGVQFAVVVSTINFQP